MPESPGHLWGRIARLDARCEVALETAVGSRPNGERWQFRITLRGEANPLQPPIITRDVSAVGAMLRAVQEAERRGWQRPDGGPRSS